MMKKEHRAGKQTPKKRFKVREKEKGVAVGPDGRGVVLAIQRSLIQPTTQFPVLF